MRKEGNFRIGKVDMQGNLMHAG